MTRQVGNSQGSMILILLNSVALLGALGLVIYTKFLYKKDVITEGSERTRLAQEQKAAEMGHDMPMDTEQDLSPLIFFEQFTTNIASTPKKPRPDKNSRSELGGKLHYATLAFALEVNDPMKTPLIDEKKGILRDRVLTILSRKTFHNLVTVQGRYILKNEIIEEANKLSREQVAINVYFTQFIVQ